MELTQLILFKRTLLMAGWRTFQIIVLVIEFIGFSLVNATQVTRK